MLFTHYAVQNFRVFLLSSIQSKSKESNEENSVHFSDIGAVWGWRF